MPAKRTALPISSWNTSPARISAGSSTRTDQCRLSKPSTVSGKRMFAGETVMQKLLAHRNDPPPSLRSTNPQVPAALETIFQRLVAKDPADRFQSVQELLDALDELQTPAPPPVARNATASK